MDFQFPYGISEQGLIRWETFQRIARIQGERGPEVGRATMRRIVDAELRAIEQATTERERREVEPLAVLVRRR